MLYWLFDLIIYLISYESIEIFNLLMIFDDIRWYQMKLKKTARIADFREELAAIKIFTKIKNT